MDAQHSSLDATEVHFVIDSIIAAFVQKSSDVNMQACLLNQQMQDVLLNGVSVDDALLDKLIPKELFQRLVDAANVAQERIAEGFSASIKSMKSEEKQTLEEGRAPTESHPTDEEPTASEPRRRCPVQEKLEKEIADFTTEIEMHSKKSGGEDVPRIVKLKKLRAACEDKLKKLRAGYKAYQRWREANKSRKCATLGAGRSSNAPLEPGKHHICGKCGKQFKTGIELRFHRRRQHAFGRLQRSFACDECNLVFTQTGHLARHRLTHSGARPFECETCHKGFSRKDKLRIHLLVHSDERPFACAKCGYRYATMVGLELHRRIHRAA